MSVGIYFVFIPFPIIAAIMAYIIVYSEWVHHYPSKKEPRKMALETAILTFIIFTAIMIFATYIFIH
jgi:hypothetical protein